MHPTKLLAIATREAQNNWRIKTTGSAVIIAGFCSTIGAFQMQLAFGFGEISGLVLPVTMLLGVATILAGLMLTRGALEAAGTSIVLCTTLCFGSVVGNMHLYELQWMFPIALAGCAVSLGAMLLTPLAFLEIRQIHRRVAYAAI
jgi:drug/metabolite transporter superfamily protein YnfA